MWWWVWLRAQGARSLSAVALLLAGVACSESPEHLQWRLVDMARMGWNDKVRAALADGAQVNAPYRDTFALIEAALLLTRKRFACSSIVARE